MLEQILVYVQLHWVEALFTCSIAGGGFLFKRIFKVLKTEKEKNEATSLGVRALLHDKILQKCQERLVDNYCTIEQLEDIEYLINPYTELGGNGSAENAYIKVKHLPTIPPNKNDKEIK